MPRQRVRVEIRFREHHDPTVVAAQPAVCGRWLSGQNGRKKPGLVTLRLLLVSTKTGAAFYKFNFALLLFWPREATTMMESEEQDSEAE
jgi:hypothetical protein